MDKIAMYVKQIEKAASRAWKANIGNLSESGFNKLVQHGILDHNKELRGLEEGTKNIIKHHNGITGDFQGKAFDDIAKERIKNGPGLRAQINRGMMTKDQALSAMKRNHALNDGYFTFQHGKTPVVTKGNLNENGFIAQGMGGLPKSDTDKRYADALVHRHEADELRFGRNAVKNKKNSILIDGERDVASRFHSHNSPKVIGAESVNVAIAPKDVKEKFMNFRDTTGEIDHLINRAGFDYGNSGKYDKRTNARLTRRQTAYNKPKYKELFSE